MNLPEALTAKLHDLRVEAASGANFSGSPEGAWYASGMIHAISKIQITLEQFQGARDGSQGRDGSEPAP